MKVGRKLGRQDGQETQQKGSLKLSSPRNQLLYGLSVLIKKKCGVNCHPTDPVSDKTSGTPS